MIKNHTRLSININKIATLRNARGGNLPNLVQVALDLEKLGVDGITIHPRPDQRHIRFQDVYDLKKVLTTELNIEGYPSEEFLNLVLDIRPMQVTLVPDAPDVLTSNAGWDTLTQQDFLKPIVAKLKKADIRLSIFIDPNPLYAKGASDLGADCVELYTEAYAREYKKDAVSAILPYIATAEKAQNLGLQVHAGHDLNLENLYFLKEKIPFLTEVSIGHAFVADALYFGFEKTLFLYTKTLLY